MLSNIVAFDLETTGLDTNYDEIIQFGAWRIENGIPVDSIEFFVRPRKKISSYITKLTGISEENLYNAKPLEDYRNIILSFFGDATIISHNILFDLEILERSLDVKFLNPKLDTLVLSRVLFPIFTQHRLSSIVEQLNLEVPTTFHRAKSDAFMAWKVFEACWQKALSYDTSFFDKLKELSNSWIGEEFFYLAHKEVTKKFPERPLRTEYVSSNVEGLFKSEPVRQPINESREWVIQSFKPGGMLENALPGYESRFGQFQMVGTVIDALINREHAVIEAGTGTGKSLAYLIPGIWWAKKQGRKLVISTHTIPLQEQIYNKDLPMLENILPFPFQSSLVKGRGNYCCLKKFAYLVNNTHDLQTEEKVTLISILVWLRETSRGDFQELGQLPTLKRIWPKISAEGEICKPSRCRYSQQCFLLKARKQAEQADIIIINHSLLFSDIKTDNNVLPEYHSLVIDEAHHLHQSAIEQLGTDVSFESILRLLDQVYKHSGTSFVGNIKSKVNRLSNLISENTVQILIQELEKLPAECISIREQANEVFRFLLQLNDGNKNFRLCSRHVDNPWWKTLFVMLENLSSRLNNLLKNFDRIIGLLSSEEDLEIDSILSELSGIYRELESITEGIWLAMDISNKDRVVWLELNGTLSIKTSPVDVKEVLEEKLFSRLESIILTSATLTISGSFEHFMQQVGLSSNTRAVQVESPFDYNNQMQFYVVKDLVNSENTYSIEDTANFISEVANKIGGRTLVLFTSNKLLSDVYQLVNHKNQDLQVLGQGIDGNRSTVLEQFLRNPRSILLGSNSFWEGIDIQGDALSCVILVKLPFWPPSMPLIEARSELLESQGISSFNQFLLPEAVIRFKQGFGRLIRSKADKGIVILLDSRVTKKYYGKVFLSSLPLNTHIRGDRKQILNSLDAWIKNEYDEKELS